MNSLESTGGWIGTLGEGEPNTVKRAELMACVVAAESTRGNVVYITDYEILKKGKIGVGPHHDLDNVAIPIFGGRCLLP